MAGKFKNINSTYGLVPITFAGGTGGSFIAYLLEAAKNKDMTPVDLSDHGNSHKLFSIHMVVPPYPTKLEYDDLLNVWTLPHENERVYPYYCGTHIPVLDDILPYFEKIIRITYDYAEIEELTTIFVGKRLFDDNIISFKNIPLVKERIELHRNHLKSLHTLFVPRPELYPKVLCISWRDIMKNDAHLLVEKLSEFTGMPVEDFNYNGIIAWRTATVKGISKMKQFYARYGI